MSTLQEKNPKDINNISEENKAELGKLGYDEWFESKNRGNFEDGFSTARIVEVNRNNYKVSNGHHEMVAELSGKFLFNVENSVDYPTVGDWVIVQWVKNYKKSIRKK